MYSTLGLPFPFHFQSPRKTAVNQSAALFTRNHPDKKEQKQPACWLLKDCF
jgi:hypothetical protein